MSEHSCAYWMKWDYERQIIDRETILGERQMRWQEAIVWFPTVNRARQRDTLYLISTAGVSCLWPCDASMLDSLLSSLQQTEKKGGRHRLTYKYRGIFKKERRTDSVIKETYRDHSYFNFIYHIVIPSFPAYPLAAQSPQCKIPLFFRPSHTMWLLPHVSTLFVKKATAMT